MAHVAEDGRWLRVNQRLCGILGYTENELLSLRFHDVSYPGELAAEVELTVRLARREIEDYSMEKRCIRRDGTIVWCELKATGVYDSEGKLKYFLRVL
jgi:PAS domain S-box-containing protein